MADTTPPYPMGCEVVEAVFVFGSQRCMKRATGTVNCDDCPDREDDHVHPVCPEHGGQLDERVVTPSQTDKQPDAPSMADSAHSEGSNRG